MNGRRRRFIAATSSMGDFRIKFTRIVSQHQQLKFAFNQLDTHIRTGLQEAADVFESLANPLMKLVGLKTVEMAEEGKYTTVVIDYPTHFHANGCKRNENRAETMVRKEASEIELAVKDQDHAKEDNLLWDLLKKKRKLGMGNGSSKQCGLPLSHLKELVGPQTPCLGPSSSPTYSSNGHRLLPMIPLGTSPSVTYPQHRPQKKIKYGFHT